MKYLLDTCIISEIIRPKPSPKVMKWIRDHDENNFYLSVLTIGELHKGIEKLPDPTRKEELHNWVENDLKERFQNRIIHINIEVAMTWGKVLGKAERNGKPMTAIDSLIAASAIAHNMTVVTRNIPDMRASGAALFNPWK